MTDRPRTFHKTAFFVGFVSCALCCYFDVNAYIVTAGLLVMALAPWRTPK